MKTPLNQNSLLENIQRTLLSFTDLWISILLAAKNGVVYELWQNIGTNFIAKLKEDPRFPSNPDKMEVLPNFESAKNFADKYGARLTTYYRVSVLNVIWNICKNICSSVMQIDLLASWFNFNTHGNHQPTICLILILLDQTF